MLEPVREGSDGWSRVGSVGTHADQAAGRGAGYVEARQLCWDALLQPGIAFRLLLRPRTVATADGQGPAAPVVAEIVEAVSLRLSVLQLTHRRAEQGVWSVVTVTATPCHFGG